MTDNLPEQRQVAPLVEFKQNLNRLKDAGEMDMLPANVSFDAFRNAAIVAVTDNPKILQCTKESVFKSIRPQAAAGLVPDGREAALVPFKTKNPNGNGYVDVCQALPMVFGLIKTARNSGEVSDIRAHIVYQREVDEGRFRYVVGDKESLEHEPLLFGDKGDAVGAYAIAVMKDGTIIRQWMDATEIDRTRRSGASQLEFQQGQRPTVSADPKGIWKDWWDQMWLKTVIRRMIKRLPLSAEDMRRVADLDETRHEMRDVTPTPSAPRQNLAQRLTGAPPEPEVRDGDVLPPEGQEPHWTEALAWDEAFPGSPEFLAGQDARKKNKPATDNPYQDNHEKAVDWAGGWWGEDRAMEGRE